MRFVIAFLLCLCAVPALAIQDQPQPQAKACASCGCAACDCLVCRCPKVVTLPNGQKAVFVPGPVDTKGGWPYMGPARWTGAVGRWVLGAPPRFVR